MTLLGDDTTDINAYEPARVTRRALVTLLDCTQVEGRDDIRSDSVTIVELADGQRLKARHGERHPPPLDIQQAMLTRKFMQLTMPLHFELKFAIVPRIQHCYNTIVKAAGIQEPPRPHAV